MSKDTYKNKWNMLKECLRFEIGQCRKVFEKALKDKDFTQVMTVIENQHTTEWVLEEMENIERKGKCL
jgi:hypothetical protein